MAGVQAAIEGMSALSPLPRRADDEPAPTMARRMFRRLLGGKSQSAQAFTSNPHHAPRPVQLALPLPGRSGGGLDKAQFDGPHLSTPPLFRETRRVEPVLSYERASLDQIVPNTQAVESMPHDRLILPGGTGLVLYEEAGAMVFAWMQWGRSLAEWHEPEANHMGATIGVQELRKGSRAPRRLPRHRCIIPLTRYSVPVRDGAMWSHQWIAPATGPVVCVAGVWSAGRGAESTFAMVTDIESDTATGPLILTEEELLPWLRAPLGDALTLIGERRAAAASDPLKAPQEPNLMDLAHTARD